MGVVAESQDGQLLMPQSEKPGRSLSLRLENGGPPMSRGWKGGRSLSMLGRESAEARTPASLALWGLILALSLAYCVALSLSSGLSLSSCIRRCWAVSADTFYESLTLKLYLGTQPG